MHVKAAHKMLMKLTPVTISLTFYEQLYSVKVFCAAFMCLQLGFECFWHKEIGTKPWRNILVKLTTGGGPGGGCTIAGNNRLMDEWESNYLA